MSTLVRVNGSWTGFSVKKSGSWVAVGDSGGGGGGGGTGGSAHTAKAVELGAIGVWNKGVSESIWQDESGNGLDLTAVGNATFDPAFGPGVGVPGSWFTDGIDGRLSRAHETLLNLGSQYHTICYWAKFKTTPQADYAQHVGKGDSAWMVRQNVGDETSIRHSVRGGSGNVDNNFSTGYTASQDVELNPWVFIAATYRDEGGTGTMRGRVYLADGTLVSDTSTLRSGLMGTNSSAFAVGAQDDAGTWRREMSGYWAGLSIYDKGLTNVEIEELRASTFEEDVAGDGGAIAQTLPAMTQSASGTFSASVSDMLMVGRTLSEIQALPDSGTSWNTLVAAADTAVARSLGTRDHDTPWLNTYYNDATGNSTRRVAGEYFACALLYARDGGATHPAETYRQTVEDALRYIIGTEVDAPFDTQMSTGDYLLAACRQLPAWLRAAELIGMDDTLTGSRSGWTGTQFGAWIDTLPTKSIGTHGRFSDMYKTVWISASNWGGMADAAYAAIGAYRNDGTKLDYLFNTILKSFTGEDVTQHPAYPDGVFSPTEGGFTATADFDSSYACNYNADFPNTGDTAWTPINGTACGLTMDGICVEDLSRSSLAFPDYDSSGIQYTREVLEGLVSAAITLKSTGRDIFPYGSNAFLRAFEWLEREGQQNTHNLQYWIPWTINREYSGAAITTVAAEWGQQFGFTDWLYGGGNVIAEMEADWQTAWDAKTQEALDTFYADWTGYQALGYVEADLLAIDGTHITIDSTWLTANEDGDHVYQADGRWHVERVKFTGLVTIGIDNLTLSAFLLNRANGLNDGVTNTANSNAMNVMGHSGVLVEFGEITQQAEQVNWDDGGRGIEISGGGTGTDVTRVRNLNIHGQSRSASQMAGNNARYEFSWVHDMLEYPNGSQVSCSVRQSDGHVRRCYFQDGNHSASGIYAHGVGGCYRDIVEENLFNMQRVDGSWGFLSGGASTADVEGADCVMRLNRFGTKYHVECGDLGSNRGGDCFYDQATFPSNSWVDNTWLTNDEFNGYIVEPNPGSDSSNPPGPSGSPAPGTSSWES